jgi:uncharacterized repeat protein (TIGR03803 family)
MHKAYVLAGALICLSGNGLKQPEPLQAAKPDRIAKTSATLTSLVNFNGINGANPLSSLVKGQDGKLYGTTSKGGTKGYGTIFQFDPATEKLTTLISFDLNNGANPMAGLIVGHNGKLFGTTRGGGTAPVFWGAVFRFNPATRKINLARFNGQNGGYPEAGLIVGPDGMFYGTTKAGGTSGKGTVFRVSPATGKLTTLFSFDRSKSGAEPRTSLVSGRDGMLYGTTEFGINTGLGTVFRLDLKAGKLTTLVSFNRKNGSFPSGLIMGKDGQLYGTTRMGGSDKFSRGTLFQLNPSTGKLTTLVIFDGLNGANPSASLISDQEGKLYGTTGGSTELVQRRQQGAVPDASFKYGTIFRFDPIAKKLTTLARFDRRNGSSPQASLLWFKAGVFYGTTAYGGANNVMNGTLFRFQLTGSAVGEITRRQ